MVVGYLKENKINNVSREIGYLPDIPSAIDHLVRAPHCRTHPLCSLLLLDVLVLVAVFSPFLLTIVLHLEVMASIRVFFSVFALNQA